MFEVKTFSNPMNALNLIDGKNCDLILLDIMMPQIDGVEFLDKMKNKCPNIEIIMMTAYSTLDRVLKSHKLGAENFLTKPFSSLKDVEDKIKRALKIG